MTITESTLVDIIETMVRDASVDLDQDVKYQIGFERSKLDRLESMMRTRAGNEALSAAMQLCIELIFAQWEVDHRSLRRWGITMRLRDKLFVGQLRMDERGRLLPKEDRQPFPVDFTAAEIAWVDLHLTNLRRQFCDGALTEAEFDQQCRALFAAPPSRKAG